MKIIFDSEFNLSTNEKIDLGFLGQFENIEVSCEFDRFDFKRMNEEKKVSELQRINSDYNSFINDVKIKNVDLKKKFLVWLFIYLTENRIEYWSDYKVLSLDTLETESEEIYYEKYDNIVTKNFIDMINENNIYKVFKEYLPNFDVSLFIESIVPTFLILNEFGIDFEINSELCNGELLCSVVGRIDKEFNLSIIDC